MTSDTKDKIKLFFILLAILIAIFGMIVEFVIKAHFIVKYW